MQKLEPLVDVPCPVIVKDRKPRIPREEEMDWSPLAALHVHQGLLVPEGVSSQRMGAAITIWQKKLGRRFSRRGRQIWRVA